MNKLALVFSLIVFFLSASCRVRTTSPRSLKSDNRTQDSLATENPDQKNSQGQSTVTSPRPAIPHDKNQNLTCPTPVCDVAPEGCKYRPSDELGERGCPIYPCGRLDCIGSSQCPVPMCDTAPEGCTYQPNEELNDIGCSKYPCGQLNCTNDALRCPVALCPVPPGGCVYRNSQELSDSGCYKYLCGQLDCSASHLCPAVSCDTPPDGCRYIPSHELNRANGCLAKPCGILDCRQQ